MICVLFGPPIQRNSFLAGITRDLRMFFAPGSRLQLLQVRQLFGTKVMLGLKTASDKSSWLGASLYVVLVVNDVNDVNVRLWRTPNVWRWNMEMT